MGADPPNATDRLPGDEFLHPLRELDDEWKALLAEFGRYSGLHTGLPIDPPHPSEVPERVWDLYELLLDIAADDKTPEQVWQHVPRIAVLLDRAALASVRPDHLAGMSPSEELRFLGKAIRGVARLIAKLDHEPENLKRTTFANLGRVCRARPLARYHRVILAFGALRHWPIRRPTHPAVDRHGALPLSKALRPQRNRIKATAIGTYRRWLGSQYLRMAPRVREGLEGFISAQHGDAASLAFPVWRHGAQFDSSYLRWANKCVEGYRRHLGNSGRGRPRKVHHDEAANVLVDAFEALAPEGTRSRVTVDTETHDLRGNLHNLLLMAGTLWGLELVTKRSKARLSPSRRAPRN